jgi:hypothetical protein
MNFIPSNQQEGQDWHSCALRHGQQHHPVQHDHQYESLTGLLLQENTPSSFNDDDSYKHDPSFRIEEELNARRERDEKRRARSLLRRICRKIKQTCFRRYDSLLVVLLGLCCIGILGSLLGILMPSEEGDNSKSLDWDTISNILGYTYFLSWTLSFYPQIITNCKRPQDARRGVSIDFLVWNMIGFACYAAYVTSFTYSDVVRKEYADRFGGGADVAGSNALSKLIPRHQLMETSDNGLIESVSLKLLLTIFGEEMSYSENQTIGFDNSTETVPNPNNSTFDNNATTNNATTSKTSDSTENSIAVPQVKLNDVAFAWHALILSVVTYVQIVWCSKSIHGDHEEDQNISSIECSVRQQRQQHGGDWATSQSYDEVFADANYTEVSPREGSILFNEQRQIHLRREMQAQGIHEQLDSLVELEHSKYYNRSQKISCTSKCLMIILLKFCIAGVMLVLVWSRWQWIDYLYFLSFVKVCISIVKYIPQVSTRVCF